MVGITVINSLGEALILTKVAFLMCELGVANHHGRRSVLERTCPSHKRVIVVRGCWALRPSYHLLHAIGVEVAGVGVEVLVRLSEITVPRSLLLDLIL